MQRWQGRGRRWQLIMVFAVGLASPVVWAGPPRGGATTKGGTTTKSDAKASSQHGSFTQAQMQAAKELGDALARFEAARKKHGRGNFKDPFWVLINPDDGGGGMNLCKVKGSKPPKDCVDPGPKPELPDGFKPPCTLCDPSTKDDLWDDYILKAIAADALHKLLELHKELEYYGAWADMVGDMFDAVTALTGPGSMAFKVIKYGAGQVASAATDAAKEAAMEAVLEGIIDALGLDLDVDDLSTEGGLNAAIALADSIAGAAYSKYRKAWNEWRDCRQDAIGSGKLPMDSQSDVDACNAEAEADFDEALEQAWDAVFDWESANTDYEACLENNKNLEITITQYQSEPCPPGMAM